ncbi:methyltransferase domain-containing protein, partial [bacterium]|nr:methyltransferase domain-containing protein [bacterium]
MSGPAVEQNGENLSFPFISKVLGISLHYGFFNTKETFTPSIESLVKGQRQFQEEVLNLIPSDIKSLLDVGTGTGDVAEEISTKDIQVTTISPDPNQAQWVKSRLNSNLNFELTKFEDFIPKQKFDCILFSESSNYVSLQELFSLSRINLKESGYLIIAAPFLLHKSESFPDMHLLDDFYQYCNGENWKIEISKDYTNETAPTLWIGQQLLENHVPPTVKLLKKYIKHQAPWYIRLLGKILYFEIKKM